MKKIGVINYIWFFLLAAGVIYGAVCGKAEAVTSAAAEYSGRAVTLCIGLMGTMGLWNGIMRIAEKSGLTGKLAQFLAPLMRRLFPDIPEGHPAAGAIALNISANILGLGNAATPFGLRAMEELQALNKNKDSASDAMILFLCINTASVTLIPTGVIAMRAAAGSEAPAAVIGPAAVASFLSCTAAVTACLIIRRVSNRRRLCSL